MWNMDRKSLTAYLTDIWTTHSWILASLLKNQVKIVNKQKNKNELQSLLI